MKLDPKKVPHRFSKKHCENRKTLPWEHHIRCQMYQVALSKSTEKEEKKIRRKKIEFVWFYL